MAKIVDINDVLKDFTKWAEKNNLDDFFDSPEEGVVFDGNDDCKTYEVTIKGLDYIDAQNVVEMGIECGTNVIFKVEEEDGEE